MSELENFWYLRVDSPPPPTHTHTRLCATSRGWGFRYFWPVHSGFEATHYALLHVTWIDLPTSVKYLVKYLKSALVLSENPFKFRLCVDSILGHFSFQIWVFCDGFLRNDLISSRSFLFNKKCLFLLCYF